MVTFKFCLAFFHPMKNGCVFHMSCKYTCICLVYFMSNACNLYLGIHASCPQLDLRWDELIFLKNQTEAQMVLEDGPEEQPCNME